MIFGKKDENWDLELPENDIIKILGTGCKKCTQLEENVKEVLEKTGNRNSVSHITDFKEIASYGVMATPALVYNEKVISVGRVLKPSEIVELLKK